MKNKMSKSKVANRVTGLQEFLDSLSKPKMQKGGKTPFGMLSVKDGYDNNSEATAADRIVGAKKKGQMGMNIKKETMENATPSIPNSYYKMGGKKEMNPLRSIVKKNKMQMGGPFFSMKPSTPMIGTEKNIEKNQSFKKGGMVKKKKK